MIRVITLILFSISSAGCVYRIADIPNAAYTNVVPEKIYIHTEADGWQRASSLATDLKKAGFEPAIVGDLNEVKDGSYIIDGIEPWGQCFSEPLFTVLTLGIVPHIGCEEFGHAFMLHRKGSDNEIRINAKYTVKVMVGWLTWPAALSSDYAYASTTVDVQLRNQTAINLLRKELTNAM